MSLKAFHIVFIVAALLVSAGFGLWGANDYLQNGDAGSLWMGLISLVVAVAIVPYASWFLRKTRKVSYL